MYKRSIVLLFFILFLLMCLSFNVIAIKNTDYCGDNVRYVYDALTKSVVISGEGDMYDYADASHSPFFCEDIVSVTIQEDVTSIGDNTFFGCESLENIIIAQSVSTIGNSAFESCYSLSEIILPDGLTAIGKGLFKGCENLKNLILPAGITNIFDSAFEWCDSLTSVVFLGEIENIASDAFSYCRNLSEIHLKGDVENSVINSIPSNINIHKSDYKETVIDCLTGSTFISLFCNTCNKDIYSKETVVQYGSHNYGEYISDGNSTCLADGTKTAVCIRCLKADTVTDIGSSTGHNWDEWKEITSAACETVGERTRKCISCGAVESEVIPALAHGNAYFADEILPTCINTGYSEGVYCPDCKKWISGHDILPASGHSGGIATCVSKAVCSKCSEEYGDFNLNKHLNIIVLPGKDATCTEGGYTQSKLCSDCEIFIENKNIINPFGHTEVEIPAIGATCVKEGTTAGVKCSVCDVIIKEPKSISAKGHSEKVVPGVEATCIDSGLSDSIICSSCNIVIKEAEIIPAKEHKEIVVFGKASTCTSKGLTDGKRCSVCKEFTVSQTEIPMKPHNYKINVEKKATFTSDGKTVQKCSCGAVKNSSDVIICSPKTFTLSTTTYIYNSNTKTPSVTVKDRKGNVMKNGVDYDVKYESGRKTPGKYTVTITFKNKYSGTKKLYFTIAPKSTNKVTAIQTSSSITLSWNKVTGADGYRVYKYNSESGKYKKIKDVSDRGLKVTGLEAGKTYKFKVKAYRKDGDTIWGKSTDAYSFSTKPGKPLKITASKTSSSVTLKWKKVTGASGYAIYRYSSGEWKRIDTVNSGSKVSCKIENLKSGTPYKFRIKAFKKAGNSTLWSSASESVTVLTDPATPTLKCSSGKKGAVTLKWSNVSGESGYQVYYSTKKDGGYKKLVTNNADVTKFTANNLKNGKTYYFKVRSYKKTSDGTLYSLWSSVCKIKVR